MKYKAIIISLLVSSYCALWGQTGNHTIKVSNDIDLIRLSPNAYIHVSRAEMGSFGLVSSNGLIFIDKGKAFLFDTPVDDAQTKTLITWVEKNLHVSFVGFVPNHWHGDCMGGLAYIKARHIPSYANRMTIDLAKKHHLPLPDKGFKDSLKLKLNDKTVECYYPGAAHSTDNIVTWIPSEKILFAGCMAKEMKATTKGNLADADLKAWPNTIKKVMAKFPSARVVIPGHGDAGGVELLRHTLEVINK
jgi:metallo-beta-lactamase class B